MGLNTGTWKYLDSHNILDFTKKKKAILIGEQQSWNGKDRGLPDGSLFKDYLRKNGWDVESIDLGTHDLASPLPAHILGKWDILFDFGTAEHIRDQCNFWKNCHDLMAPEGIRIHALPPPNSWYNHCKHRYTEKFFKDLCHNFNYKLENFEEFCIDNKKELRLLICKIVNSELEFSKERFDKYCMKNIEVIHEFVDNESL